MEKYLSPAEVCDVIPGMNIPLLNQMRFRGDSIPYVRVSPRKIVYRLAAVEEFLKSKEQKSTLENSAA